MKAYTLMSAYVGMQTALPRGWRLEFTVGAKNLLGQEWFTRTDDLNGGLLAMRPRTFYLNLAVAHEFIRTRAAGAGAGARGGTRARGPAALDGDGSPQPDGSCSGPGAGCWEVWL
jgi:hypothetical protein